MTNPPSLSCSGWCCDAQKQFKGEVKIQQWCTLYSPLFLWYTGTRGFHWQLMQRIGGKILLSSTVKNTAWYHSCSLHYGKVKSWIINFIKSLKCEGWSLLSRNYYFYSNLMLMNDYTGRMGHMEIVLKICKTSQKPIKHQLLTPKQRMILTALCRLTVCHA